MKKNISLSMIATCVIGVLSYNIASARVVQSSLIKPTDISAQNPDEVSIFVNTQQRSLYQIALLSNISVTELRDLNKGSFDNTDIVKAGESIILPTSSTLLPAEAKTEQKENKYASLPSLGSSDKVDANLNSDSAERQVATVLQTLGGQDWDNMSSQKLKEDLNNQTKGYAENYVRSQVNSQVIDPIRSAAQDFLGRFGTAQLQFDVSDQAKLNNVNVKLFSPWYDTDSTLIFSQLTYQEYEKDRRIGNFGIGQRWDVADKSWLVGYNVFFDHDFSRNHNRLGLGLEAWSDYMKFAANYYTPLSDWKDSKDFDDYLERAARGYDIRFQGYLPSYPHLGGSLMFEQYFGDKVALFGKDNLQKDPYAVTVGVDYTPVPLFTIKGEHKQGENANKMAKVELTMNYRLGVPLKDQLDPNMVDVARSLKGSRYDLVDRNNYIVLEYKEKKFSVDLASLGEWEEGKVLPLAIAVHNAKGNLSPLLWGANYALDLATLSADNGDLCYNRSSTIDGTSCNANNLWNGSVGRATNDTANWSVLVPNYLNAVTGERNPIAGTTVQAGRYTLDVTLTDGNGRTATSNTSWLAVKPSSNRQVLLTNITENPTGSGAALGSSASVPASANGVQSITLQANLLSKDFAVTPGIANGGVTGYTDYSALLEYTISSATNGPWAAGTKFTSTAPTADEIANINKLYTATSGGNKVTFVAEDGTNQCPTKTPKCLIVKSISKVVGSATVSDDYQIEVATNAALSSVDISFKLSSYAASAPTYGMASAPTTLYFSGGTPSKITISNGSTVVGVANNSKVIEMSGKLTVGEVYTVKVEDNANNDITSASNIVWSLVGDNTSACFTSNTILPGDTNPTGDDPTGKLDASGLFNISNSANYQIRGLVLPNPSYASSIAGASSGGSLISINGKSLQEIAVGGSRNDACAGDQGFKLRIDVN